MNDSSSNKRYLLSATRALCMVLTFSSVTASACNVNLQSWQRVSRSFVTTNLVNKIEVGSSSIKFNRTQINHRKLLKYVSQMSKMDNVPPLWLVRSRAGSCKKLTIIKSEIDRAISCASVNCLISP